MGRDFPRWAAVHILVIALSLVVAVSGHAVGDDAADAQQLLKAHIEYLCSDALEGRGLGSKGLNLASTYLADQFRQHGLKTAWYQGTPFQYFNGAMKVQLGPNNRLVLVGPSCDSPEPDGINLVLGHDYIPLAIGGSGKGSIPLAFAGYGISNPEQHYDDYEQLDVAGKAVITLNGRAPEKIHTWKDKAWVARKRGARAVLFVHTSMGAENLTKTYLEMCEKNATDLAEECKKFRATANPTLGQITAHLSRVDTLLARTSELQGFLYDLHDIRFAFAGYANEVDPGYPILSVKRSVVDHVLKSVANTELSTLEKKIADELKPQSLVLSGWSIEGEAEVQRTPIKARNVVAVLEGAGELADEAVVLGAHYDAVGFRDIHAVPAGMECECPIIAPRTRYDPRMASPKVACPGANDNASGTAVVLEVAREMAQLQQSPRRRVVFIAFATEELGSIGSKAYVRQPLFPLAKTVAMVNLDMVGRLQDDKMNVFGASPAGLFSELLDHVGPRHRFHFNKLAVKPLAEDQAPFHQKRIPTLYFATGPDDRIHSPEDRPGRLNIAGMQRISAMLAELITALATDPNRPEFAGPEPTWRGSVKAK